MADIPEALLGDKIPFEDHIADDIVLMKGNGVMAMFAVAGVFPDTADEVDIAGWFDRLHNALKNIAAEDIELTIYQCRGEADRSVYEDSLHRSAFARELGSPTGITCCVGRSIPTSFFWRSRSMRRTRRRKASRRFLADAVTDPRAGINERQARLNEICDLLQTQLAVLACAGLAMSGAAMSCSDEIAEAIVFAMTGTWRQIGASTGRMGNAMFSRGDPVPPQAGGISWRRRDQLRRDVSRSRNIRSRPGPACSTGWRWRPTATR